MRFDFLDTAPMDGPLNSRDLQITLRLSTVKTVAVSTILGDLAHTNGNEVFWVTQKRAYYGTFHHVNKKHLNCYLTQLRASTISVIKIRSAE